MSKINLTPNASGTGTLTVTSPNTNSDYTLTLPAVTGTFNTSGAVNEVPAGSNTAPSIYFTGDTNTGIFSPAADTIAFTEGGTEAMRIDSSGRVGIGVSSPTWRLEVAGNNGSEFKVSRGTNEFGVSLSNNAGSVVYVGAVADSPLALMTNATERVRINSSGTVILQGGSTSATGVGITFPATQSASTDANTLDDYEEGTWTPTYFGASTAGTSTYTLQTGIYTKVGRLVTVTGRVGVSAATGTGQLRIGGLPFTCNATLGAYTAPMVSDVNWGGGTYLILVPIVGETNCEVFYCADDAAIVNQSVTNESQSWSFTFSYNT